MRSRHVLQFLADARPNFPGDGELSGPKMQTVPSLQQASDNFDTRRALR